MRVITTLNESFEVCESYDPVVVQGKPAPGLLVTVTTPFLEAGLGVYGTPQEGACIEARLGWPTKPACRAPQHFCLLLLLLLIHPHGSWRARACWLGGGGYSQVTANAKKHTSRRGGRQHEHGKARNDR